MGAPFTSGYPLIAARAARHSAISRVIPFAAIDADNAREPRAELPATVRKAAPALCVQQRRSYLLEDEPREPYKSRT